uniref:Uncharacterized protein n=1 Tax=Leersia perrieri TaxID=77586 RepID=A0A0D9VWK1_9ORYZ
MEKTKQEATEAEEEGIEKYEEFKSSLACLGVFLAVSVVCALVTFLWPGLSPIHKNYGLWYSVLFLIAAVFIACMHLRQYGFSVPKIEEPDHQLNIIGDDLC